MSHQMILLSAIQCPAHSDGFMCLSLTLLNQQLAVETTSITGEMFKLTDFLFFSSTLRIKAIFSNTPGFIYITGSLDVYAFLPAVGSNSQSLLECSPASMRTRSSQMESHRILPARRFLTRTLISFARAAVNHSLLRPRRLFFKPGRGCCSGWEQNCSVTVGEKGGSLAA